MAKITIDGLPGLRRRLGSEVCVSDWLEVSQDRINRFAAATGDFQWIHVDVARAERESNTRTTIAHGLLTLSLLPKFLAEGVELAGVRMGVNYGFNRVRFTAPVPSGARVRARFAIAALEELEGGVQITWGVTVELEGDQRPALVAEWLNLRYFS
jgi:acyl dehydratase